MTPRESLSFDIAVILFCVWLTLGKIWGRLQNCSSDTGERITPSAQDGRIGCSQYLAVVLFEFFTFGRLFAWLSVSF